MSHPLKERLERAEKYLTGGETPTYTEAMVTVLELLYGVAEVVEPLAKETPELRSRLDRLEARVAVGIGLTVAVGLAGGLALLFGG